MSDGNVPTDIKIDPIHDARLHQAKPLKFTRDEIEKEIRDRRGVEAMSKTDVGGQSPYSPMTMDNLRALARSSPLVDVHFNLWQRGHFQSLEAMLVSLACHLANTNKVLEERERVEMSREPGPPIIREAYAAWEARREWYKKMGRDIGPYPGPDGFRGSESLRPAKDCKEFYTVVPFLQNALEAASFPAAVLDPDHDDHQPAIVDERPRCPSDTNGCDGFNCQPFDGQLLTWLITALSGLGNLENLSGIPSNIVDSSRNPYILTSSERTSEPT